jgi:hypothetical protein
MNIKLLFFFAAALLGCTVIAADEYDSGEVTFGDSTITPTTPTIATHTITGAEFENRIVTSVRVELTRIKHTWVGDLIVSLSKGSDSVFLINRPGVTSTDPIGYGSDFGADEGNGRMAATYGFQDNGSDFWMTAGAVPITDYIPADADFAPVGLNDSPQSLDANFGGMSLAGDWTLRVEDAQTGNDSDNMIDAFRLRITTVPEPGAIAGIAVLGLGGSIYARRRYLAKKGQMQSGLAR